LAAIFDSKSVLWHENALKRTSDIQYMLYRKPQLNPVSDLGLKVEVNVGNSFKSADNGPK